MSEEDKKNLENLKVVLLGLFVIFIFLIIQWLYIDSIGNPFDFANLAKDETKRSALGALGDYFGGLLNPVLAFLSFIALLYTLRINQEELAETRKELARAATAQEESQKLMDSQCETQKVQQFDSLFTVLISQLSDRIEKIEKNLEQHDSLTRTLYRGEYTDAEIRQKIIKNSVISSFFIFLYQILKYIDESFEAINIKRRYSNIIRSLIPDQILKILLINCYLNTLDLFHKSFFAQFKIIDSSN